MTPPTSLEMIRGDEGFLPKGPSNHVEEVIEWMTDDVELQFSGGVTTAIAGPRTDRQTDTTAGQLIVRTLSVLISLMLTLQWPTKVSFFRDR